MAYSINCPCKMLLWGGFSRRTQQAACRIVIDRDPAESSIWFVVIEEYFLTSTVRKFDHGGEDKGLTADHKKAGNLVYRGQHSRSVAVIAESACAPAVDAARPELRSVRHFLELCPEGSPPRPGWESLQAALARCPDDDGAGRETRASDPALVYYT